MSHASQPERLSTLELTPVLGQRFALGARHLLLAIAAGTIFLCQSHIPLADAGLWGDVATGDWILNHQAVPKQDPFVTLAEGMPFVDSQWLAQVALAAAHRAGGTDALSLLLCVTVLATVFFFAQACFQRSASIGLSCGCALVVWLLDWNARSIAESSPFGHLCFAVLLCLVSSLDTSRARPWATWVVAAILFAVWANVAESFLLGLVIVAAFTLGRAAEVLRDTRRIAAIINDAMFRRWLVTFEIAVAATLVNPYGDGLLVHLLLSPTNTNLLGLAAWQPIDLTSHIGIGVAITWLATLALLRHSKAPVKPVEVLLFVGFSAAAVVQTRFATYFFPIAIFVLIPHISDVVERIRRTRPVVRMRVALRPMQARSFRYTLLSCLAVWLAFAFSPVSRFVLGGAEPSAQRVYGNRAPLKLADYLIEHSPVGQIANPAEWGDWFVGRGPEGLQVFMTTRSVSSVPHQVWSDYLAISHGDSGFENLLSRYRVNTLVADKHMQPKLTAAVRRSTNWRIAYEDELGIVALRVGTND